jgi:hypothetical protein
MPLGRIPVAVLLCILGDSTLKFTNLRVKLSGIVQRRCSRMKMSDSGPSPPLLLTSLDEGDQYNIVYSVTICI